MASGEVEPPLPPHLTSTALTPFDLPKLVMDFPPIPAIKLPATPPPNSAAIKRHLFDSPLLSAQSEELQPEQCEAQEKVVSNKSDPPESSSALSFTRIEDDLGTGKLTTPPRADDAFEQPLCAGGENSSLCNLFVQEVTTPPRAKG